jgi:hypothetical protein
MVSKLTFIPLLYPQLCQDLRPSNPSGRQVTVEEVIHCTSLGFAANKDGKTAFGGQFSRGLWPISKHEVGTVVLNVLPYLVCHSAQVLVSVGRSTALSMRLNDPI